MRIICPHCGSKADKPASAVNRARMIGASVYCSRLCAGLARRKWKSAAQKKEEKAIYDALRRAKLHREIKQQKSEYHKRTYDPIAAAEKRHQRMPSHLEYCRQPKYKQWKKTYDRQRLAKKSYGEFADAFLVLRDIDCEVDSRMTDYEVRMANGTMGKRQQRKREYAALISDRP